ncbi:MAG: GNAT family N-acetyltransferase [Chloroflexi bacterium]|nr:GNAT family N-acetyltransferase [Chloroflexota bacterium]
MNVTFRPGTTNDSYAMFGVFRAAVVDLQRRIGMEVAANAFDPAEVDAAWQRYRPLFQHLAEHNEHFWVAENAGQIVGYARSILRGTVRELTEFFVHPGNQSAGVGRELLALAFPAEGATNRFIVATSDTRALGRYMKSGVRPQFTIFGMYREPVTVEPPDPDVSVTPLTGSAQDIAFVAEVDSKLLGFRRDPEQAWLTANRQGFAYWRGGAPVGYGYVSQRSGPFAALDSHDLPAILAHAESHAASLGIEEFGIDVPAVNHSALGYLIGRGYHIDPFYTFFLSDTPFGAFEQYLLTVPPFFV